MQCILKLDEEFRISHVTSDQPASQPASYLAVSSHGYCLQLDRGPLVLLLIRLSRLFRHEDHPEGQAPCNLGGSASTGQPTPSVLAQGRVADGTNLSIGDRKKDDPSHSAVQRMACVRCVRDHNRKPSAGKKHCASQALAGGIAAPPPLRQFPFSN